MHGSCSGQRPSAASDQGPATAPVTYVLVVVVHVWCHAPHQVRIFWSSKSFAGATEEREPIYQTEYSLTDIPPEWRQAWAAAAAAPTGSQPGTAAADSSSAHSAAPAAAASAANTLMEMVGKLHLPEPNPFVPSNFELYKHEDEIEGPAAGGAAAAAAAAEPAAIQTPSAETVSTTPAVPAAAAVDVPSPPPAAAAGSNGATTKPFPTVVVDTPLMRLYHKLDTTFNTPKAVIYLDFQCPEAYSSPDNAVLTRLFVKLLSDYLNEMAYPAELAGLGYVVHNSLSGFTVVVSGYNHKLLTLLGAILAKLAGFSVREDRYAVVLEEVAKEYTNMK